MAQLMPLPLTISCSVKIQIGFTFLVPAHLGSPGQRSVKRVCVCITGRRCTFTVMQMLENADRHFVVGSGHWVTVIGRSGKDNYELTIAGL